MTSYKVTCLFVANWPDIIPALFGSANPSSSQISGNIGLFNFDVSVTPNNLGPLVIVEQTVETQLFP